MKRLFISLPDHLPETLDGVPWRMPGALPESGTLVGAGKVGLPDADEIWLALPASRVLLSEIALSRGALRQLRGALGNALEDRLMLEPSQVHVALGKISAADNHPVAVIEITWLEQALALCRQQGIEPFGAIPESLIWLGEDAAGQWSGRWNGHAGFVRSGACAGFALDDGAAATPPLALQLAVAEAHKAGVAPGALVIESTVEVDVDAWSGVLDCPVLAHPLRADPHPPVINLLQGTYAARRGGGWLSDLVRGQQAGKFRLAAGLAAAALGVHVAGSLIDWARLSWENRQLRGEMRQVFQDTFPQTRAIVDPVLQMQRQLADMRRARGFAEHGDFLHALDAAGGQIGGISGLSYDNNRLTLQQPRATDLEAMRTRLAALGYRMATAGEPGNPSITLERSRP